MLKSLAIIKVSNDGNIRHSADVNGAIASLQKRRFECKDQLVWNYPFVVLGMPRNQQFIQSRVLVRKEGSGAIDCIIVNQLGKLNSMELNGGDGSGFRGRISSRSH